jgi:hypothetical protein
MFISVLFILFITLGIGLPLTFLVIPKIDTLGRLGLCYPISIGVFTLLVYLCNLCGLKLTSFNYCLVSIPLSFILVILRRHQILDFSNSIINSWKKISIGFTEKALVVGISSLFVSSIVSTFYWPPYVWDTLTLYDFRAKLFTQVGFVKSALVESYMFGYPLLTSLSHTIVYLFGGDNPQFLYSLFYVSLGLIFYSLIREFSSRTVALFSTLVLLMIPQVFFHSQIAYTNLPYITYFSSGCLFFCLWNKKKNFSYLVLSGLFIGLSTWTRSSEPFWLTILIIVFLTSLFSKNLKNILIFAIFLLPIQQLWRVFVSSTTNQGSVFRDITVSMSYLLKFFDLNRWVSVFIFLYKSVVVPWGIIFIVYLCSIFYLVVTKRWKQSFLLNFIIFALFATLVCGTFVFTYTFSEWSQIPDSTSRVAMIFYPLFVYNIALALSDSSNNK